MAIIQILCADSERLRDHLAILSQLNCLLGLRSRQCIGVSTTYRKTPIQTISVNLTVTDRERGSPHFDHFVEMITAYIRLLRPQAHIETHVTEPSAQGKARRKRRVRKA